MSKDHGLSAAQLQIIKDILRPYADKIEKIVLFGSRATGGFRHNSDIDLALYGDLNRDDIDHLWTLFDSSDLPLKVDILAYHLANNMALKRHIDKVGMAIDIV